MRQPETEQVTGPRCKACLGQSREENGLIHIEDICADCGREYMGSHLYSLVPEGVLWCTEGEKV